MSLPGDILSLMPHEVGIKPYLSSDGWGNKVYGAIVYYKARVINKRRKVLSPTGGEVISETTCYLDTTSVIGMDDQVVLPSGFTPTSPQIIAVKLMSDEDGAYYTVLNC